jgi:hypothetical protein
MIPKVKTGDIFSLSFFSSFNLMGGGDARQELLTVPSTHDIHTSRVVTIEKKGAAEISCPRRSI